MIPDELSGNKIQLTFDDVFVSMKNKNIKKNLASKE